MGMAGRRVLWGVRWRSLEDAASGWSKTTWLAWRSLPQLSAPNRPQRGALSDRKSSELLETSVASLREAIARTTITRTEATEMSLHKFFIYTQPTNTFSAPCHHPTVTRNAIPSVSTAGKKGKEMVEYYMNIQKVLQGSDEFILFISSKPLS